MVLERVDSAADVATAGSCLTPASALIFATADRAVPALPPVETCVVKPFIHVQLSIHCRARLGETVLPLSPVKNVEFVLPVRPLGPIREDNESPAPLRRQLQRSIVRSTCFDAL